MEEPLGNFIFITLNCPSKSVEGDRHKLFSFPEANGAPGGVVFLILLLPLWSSSLSSSHNGSF